MASESCVTGETLRIVLLGKTGAGKSSLANALTGLKAPKVEQGDKRDERPPEKSRDSNIGFKVGRGLKSKTVFCDWKKSRRLGTVLEVTDTPGLCDTHLSKYTIYKEVAKSVAVAEPGPNVIIFTLRCDRPFTEEEHQAYIKIKTLFSDDINKYLIIVFNGLDVFDDAKSIEEQRAYLAEQIRDYGDPLSGMMTEASNRFFGMNGKAPPEDKERQVFDLIKMMKDLVRGNSQHPYYQTQMSDQIMQRVEELASELSTTTELTMDEAIEDIKENIVSEKVDPGFWEFIVEVVTGSASKVKDGVESMCSIM